MPQNFSTTIEKEKMEQCEWCHSPTKQKLTTVQIIKWKDELTHGIRKVCPDCKRILKGEIHVFKFDEHSNKYLMLVGKIRYIQRQIRERRYGDLQRIVEDLSQAISDIEKAEREYINIITRRPRK